MITEKFYTAEDAAVLLNSNIQSIRRLINSDKLTAFKKLGKWYVFHSDIVKYLKNTEND
jgi:glycerol-3-phosphate responsive antiterminator